MAYRPTAYMVKDGAYPSEVANQRPMLATRIHCEATDYDEFLDHPENEDSHASSRTIRGDRSDDQVARFNEALNSDRGSVR